MTKTAAKEPGKKRAPAPKKVKTEQKAALDDLGQNPDTTNSQQPTAETPQPKEIQMTEPVQTPETEVKKIKFCEKSMEGSVAMFKFGDGDVLKIDLAELPEETQNDLRDHGALQKIGDSYASAGGDYAFAKAAAAKVIANLEAGQFNSTRTPGEGKKSQGELAVALAALQGKEVAEVSAALENATDEQKKALRGHPAVKAKIAEIRATKAAEALAKAGDAGVLPQF